MSLSWIDEYVCGVLEHCNSKNVNEIYSCLGIKIIKLQEENILLRDSEAFYHRNYFGEEIVFIRTGLDYEYEKFILAHELGHALLHTEMASAAFNRKLLNKGKFERQANYFALNLLNIKIDYADFEGYSISDIAKLLHVSEESLKYCLSF